MRNAVSSYQLHESPPGVALRDGPAVYPQCTLLPLWMCLNLHCQTCPLLFIGVFAVFVVFVFAVVLGEKRGVFGQSRAHFLLLLESPGVGHLDVAPLGCGFVYDLLQPGVELAVRLFQGRVVACDMVFVPGVAAMLGWDFIQDLGLRFLFAREGQFPPARVRHGTKRRPVYLDK